MGCKTNSFSDECDDNHCNKSVPALFGVSGAGGVTFEYEEYPQATIRSDGRYNLPDREADAVMHTYYEVEYDTGLGAPPAICGMVSRLDPCRQNFGRDNFNEACNCIRLHS